MAINKKGLGIGLGIIVAVGIGLVIITPIIWEANDDDRIDISPYLIEVETLNATAVSTSSVTLRGEITELEEDIEIEVCFEWGESPGNYTHETMWQNMNSTGIFSTEIIGPFTDGNTYYYIAKADHDEYGEEKSFQITTEIEILTYEAEKISDLGAILYGELTKFGGESSIEVYFVWGEISGDYTYTTSKQTMTDTGPFFSEIPGPFTIGTTYYFRARTDHGEEGIERSFFIPGDVEVVTLNATMISTIFVTLNGELIDLGGSPSVEVYFVWGESSGTYTQESSRQTMSSLGNFSIEISDLLMPDNTYFFQARADPGGRGEEMSFYVP